MSSPGLYWAGLSWSPDGKSLATRGGEHELWLMENFIDLVKRAR